MTLVIHPGSPAPHTPRRHYPRVLAQLLLRMRLDLMVMVSLCLGTLLIHPLLRVGVIRGTGLPILGIAVSIFLAFRNTQAINRWWEARSLWGVLLNQSRHWRDILLAVLGPNARQARVRLLQLQVLLIWLVNFELRNVAQRSHRQRALALAASLDLPEQVTVQQVSQLRAEALHQLVEQHRLSDLGRDALLRSAEAFTGALGGLQKIRNTPIPPAYDVFVRLITWLFGYALFVDFMKNGSPFSGGLLFLGFLVAERIGAYVEGPFDRDGSSFSLPLDQICLTISADLLADDSPFADQPRCSDPSIWT